MRNKVLHYEISTLEELDFMIQIAPSPPSIFVCDNTGFNINVNSRLEEIG